MNAIKTQAFAIAIRDLITAVDDVRFYREQPFPTPQEAKADAVLRRDNLAVAIVKVCNLAGATLSPSDVAYCLSAVGADKLIV